MPPYVPRKRLREATPEPSEKGKGKAKTKALTAPPRKPTLFDDLDATATPQSSSRNGSKRGLVEESEDDESSLTSLPDNDFEDVPLAKRQKVAEVEDDDDDEDVEFEDVEPLSAAVDDQEYGDLQLTITRDTRIHLTGVLGKKGPSKIERRVRISAHCIHVQLLMWHNAIRNSWICDPEVQGILVSHIPPRLWEEVDRWRRNSGLEVEETPKKTPTTKGTKGKGKGKAQPARDWGEAAQRLEKGAVDMSHGDPLFRLMKALTAWWRQRFRVSAPGLRKGGYMSLERLDRFTRAFNQEDHDAEKFGERIRSVDEFRKCAQECAGSRDVGGQLFTALLRGLGLEARMVANLQPLGFGWTKQEEADPEREPNQMVLPPKEEPKKPKATEVKVKASKVPPAKPARRASARTGAKTSKHDPSDYELVADNSDDEPVIEAQQPLPRRGKAYDTDLEFPHYWTEVLSPVTNKYLTVDPIVKNVIAVNRDLVESFEPRGSKAEKAKQVMAYVVAFSPDGTAKDVTVRYLKRQTFPGRTKGFRMPLEKIPVYNRHGKVKRYDTRDWFKIVMKGYVRGDKGHPLTETDHLEDLTDLKPAVPEKKEVKEGEETLQYYKQSKEFVLERHLKREEALLPGTKPVRMFRMGKGKGKNQEEPVYSRKDVVQVKSAETWHKQGRAPIEGEEPLKRVPYRAATTNRRREIAEAEAATGAKVLQGLYSFDQTDWIIPPPIENGVIPKNEYGNIDLFAEHMCPEGAVHVPYRGAMRVAKRLGIDYAEAVVDFEFGHRMAVPVIQGVVIAAEYHDRVMEELAKDEAEKARKEDEKRRKKALAMWRKFLMGLRIVERVGREYGDKNDDVEIGAADEDMAGGFLPEGYEEEEEGEKSTQLTSGYFPVHDHDEDEEEGKDTLEVDHGDADIGVSTAVSVMSTKPKKQTAKKAISTRRRRRPKASSSDEEDEDEEDEYGGSESEDD
ncbi:hypothetical protein OQA88_11075 [Cercophora sp. LCS_1]